MRRGMRRACAVLGTAGAAALFAVVPVAASTAVATPAGCGPAGYGVRFYSPGTGKTVALTFDDGPGRDTARIVRILSAAHVEATFFNLGIYEEQSPALVRSEKAAGFALGGHTWDHADLTQLGAAGQAQEIDRERRAQASITGAYPCLFRPPYGNYDATTLELAQSRGMRVWNWSVDPEDWKAAGSGDTYWVKRIVARAEAGTALQHPVIILHNQAGGNPATVAALPTIINYYKAHGYRFVDLYGRCGHPVVRRITPSSGPAGGGTRVTITGHGFIGVQAVRFGGTAGRRVTVLSDTALSVTSPAHAAGRVHVWVVTTFGASPMVSADLFRYVPS